MYICICNAITERQVRESAKRGARSVEELAGELGVGAGCGRCLECAAVIIKEVLETERPCSSGMSLIPFAHGRRA